MSKLVDIEPIILDIQRNLMPGVDEAGMVQIENAERYFLNKLFNAEEIAAIQIPDSGVGEVSDGYHTFNELYHHRAILFSVICNSFPELAWKSKAHDTGGMFEGMFIVGIETPEGQATYHYDIEPYWDMYKIKELDRAPKWDGHTPSDAIKRLASLITVKQAKWTYDGTCSNCGKHVLSNHMSYCPACGYRMEGN